MPHPCALQPLEPRQMLSASVEGQTLHVTGTDSNDAIHVLNLGAGKLIVTTNGQNEGTFENITALSVDTGPGNDTINILAGSGLTNGITLNGGTGDDVLTYVGTGTVSLTGGEGTDAFWASVKAKATLIDPSPLERKRGINRLPDVFSTVQVGTSTSSRAVGAVWDDVKDAVSDGVKWVNKTLNNASSLTQPTLTKAALGFVDFSDYPLFSNTGPTPLDITQGALNNCYLLASLSGISNADPSLIKQTITDLGDGTYAVRIMKGSKSGYYRVDASLPVRFNSNTPANLAYAKLGQDGSLWVGLVEKAYALARGGSYKKLDTGGWMADVYKAFGVTAKTLNPTGNIISLITNALDAGSIITIGTKKKLKDLDLVQNHAYAVDSVEFDASGKVSAIILTNPYGSTSGTDHGITTVSVKSFIKAISGAVIGGV